MTTLEALAVIVVAVIIAGFLPRISLGGGFGLDIGNAVVGLGLAIAAFSPKRARKGTRRDDTADE